MKISRTNFGMALALASAGLVVAPAQAQTNCGLRDIVVKRLESGYGEGLAAGGLHSDSQVLEVWAAPKTGTWTVLITSADGRTCVLASGTDWHQKDLALIQLGVPG